MARRVNLEVDTYDRYPTPKPMRSVDGGSSSSASLSSIFGGILLVLVIMNIPRAITGQGFNFTFSALLDTLQDVPTIDITWVSDTFKPIVDDWGAFNFLRTFINFFVDSLSAVAFIGTGIVQVITFVAHFISVIFSY